MAKLCAPNASAPAGAGVGHGRSLANRLTRVGDCIFVRRGDVFSAVALEDFFGAASFLVAIGVNRDEDVALSQPIIVTPGFKFRDAHANERAGKAARGG